MKFDTKSLIVGLSMAGILGGCAAVAPAQLVDARGAYAVSSAGMAAQLTPTELHDAKKALDQANQEFDRNGDTPAVRDYSYIALRKVQLADVRARTEADRSRIAEAAKQGVVVRDLQVKNARADLAEARDQIKDERAANVAETSGLRATASAQGKELDKASAQLEAEKQARQTAEAKLAGAMKDLAAVAAVREEARGVVITLSGSVLFPSGKYALLETAKTKLDQVAEALKAQGEDKQMTVEGHTDSQGTDAMNRPLSLNRANAVREYLLTRGVDPKRITAVGLGSSRPLVENNNAENRANNRRVEIIIRPEPVSTR